MIQFKKLLAAIACNIKSGSPGCARSSPALQADQQSFAEGSTIGTVRSLLTYCTRNNFHTGISSICLASDTTS